jgi:hypothetical protein
MFQVFENEHQFFRMSQKMLSILAFYDFLGEKYYIKQSWTKYEIVNWKCFE